MHEALDGDGSAANPTGSGIRYEVRGAVAYLTLDQPARRNPQNPQTWTTLARIGAQLLAPPRHVRIAVVRGEGSSFSAGLDRAVLQGLVSGTIPALTDDDVRAFQAGFSWLADTGIITIAAVHGHAVGAGFQLALACDIRIAAKDALFAMAEVSYGLVPDLGGTKRLVELVGYSRAVDICVTGRPIGAEEALRIGLVNAVVAGDDLEVTVERYVESILALPHGAIVETKALLAGASSRPQSEQEAAERAAQLRRFDALGDRRGAG